MSPTLGFLYASNGYQLTVFDVQNPHSPLELGTYDNQGTCVGLAVVGGTVYMVMSRGLDPDTWRFVPVIRLSSRQPIRRPHLRPGGDSVGREITVREGREGRGPGVRKLRLGARLQPIQPITGVGWGSAQPGTTVSDRP